MKRQFLHEHHARKDATIREDNRPGMAEARAALDPEEEKRRFGQVIADA